MESPTAGLQETERSVDVGRSLSAAERETTVTITDADDLVRIWTAQRRYLGRLRRHPSFTEVKSGTHGGTEWAEFTIPARDWNPATGAKRKSGMTDAQKAALAERLQASRATIARSGELDTEPPAILDVSRAETQIRPQWDHDGPRPTAPDVTHRHSQCGADITHRDEHHRQSVCVRASGHSGAHDDGQGCVWTGATSEQG